MSIVNSEGNAYSNRADTPGEERKSQGVEHRPDEEHRPGLERRRSNHKHRAELRRHTQTPSDRLQVRESSS